jgi:hypothetical protein
MRTVSADRASIDYWQNYGNVQQVLKSHFGIRVWQDRCCAITNVAAEIPSLFGKPHPIPVDLSEGAGKHSLSNVVSEHMNHHPESDLFAVLTGKKTFREALG